MAEPRPADVDAYEAAVRESWTAVYRFALALTNDLTEAEDLSQEAFARLWRDRARIDWSRPVLPWLLVVTRRLGVDRLRVLRRRLTRALVPPPSFDPSIVEAFADLRVELDRLTRIERASLLGMSVSGLAAGDVADALGITAGAVRAAASRARDKLGPRR